MDIDPQIISRTRPKRRAPPRRTASSFRPMGRNVLLGLSAAGVASSLLIEIFQMFHVELFLKAYQLPLTTYSVGSAILTVINTANSLAGAWIIDHIATTRERSDITGLSGCLLSIFFLAPFFRWWDGSSSSWWDGVHFVISIALFDAMRSFTTTLLGAIVNDNHHMTDRDRVRFMASGKVANFIASLVVTRLGLELFDTEKLDSFRGFVFLLAFVVALLFVVAQAMIISGKSLTRRYRDGGSYRSLLWSILLPLRHYQQLRDGDQHGAPSAAASQQHHPNNNVRLRWRKVVLDFWNHKNFMAWICMEMLLEAQLSFITIFLQTFVDRLLIDAGIGRQACEWLLSMIRPLTQLGSIFCFIPIRQMGYPRVYTLLFCFNAILSLTILSAAWAASAYSEYWALCFICTYPVITGAVQSACFHLAQADMIMERKRKNALEGRHREPSLAGLFLGANALLCRPIESFLPITAATVLQNKGDSSQSLFYLLVVPPLICSCFQLVAWSCFDLSPARTAKMREELKLLRKVDSVSAIEDI